MVVTCSISETGCQGILNVQLDVVIFANTPEAICHCHHDSSLNVLEFKL